MKPRSRSSSDDPVGVLSAEWERGDFKPVYLFAGADAFEKEETLKTLQARFLGGEDAGLNVDRLDGTSARAGDILNAAGTLPFLSGRRLILVRRADELPAEEANRLADGLAGIAPGNCLVLLWDGKAEAANVLVQAVKTAGAAATFWVPFENQLPGWIQRRAQSFGKSMSADTARLCLEAVGPNLSDLNQELEKLSTYVKDRKNIEPADVEALRPESRTLQFFEWDRAFWRRDRAKALEVLALLRGQGEEPHSLLAQILRIHRRLLLGKAMLSEKKVPIDGIFKALRIGSYETRREFERALQSFSWKDMLDALERILRAEHDLKTGRLEPEVGLSLLVGRLTETSGKN